MKLFNMNSMLTVITAISAITAARDNLTRDFLISSVCDSQTKIITCSNNSTKLDIGIAVYGQVENNMQCSKEAKDVSSKTCMNEVTTQIRQRCEGKQSCEINNESLTNECKINGPKILKVVYACPRQRRNSKKLISQIKKIVQLNRKMKLIGISYKHRLQFFGSQKKVLQKKVRAIRQQRKHFYQRALYQLKNTIKNHTADPKASVRTIIYENIDNCFEDPEFNCNVGDNGQNDKAEDHEKLKDTDNFEYNYEPKSSNLKSSNETTSTKNVIQKQAKPEKIKHVYGNKNAYKVIEPIYLGPSSRLRIITKQNYSVEVVNHSSKKCNGNKSCSSSKPNEYSINYYFKD